MAEMEFKRDLGGLIREAIIRSLADLIDAVPQYRFAVILELLHRDPISRTMIAEAMGEATLREQRHDYEQQEILDATDCTQGEVRDLSWDEILLKELELLMDTPGGRGEVV